MKSVLLVSALTILVAPFPVDAHPRGRYCHLEPSTSWASVKRLEAVGPCEVRQPLSLSRTSRSYPLLGTYEVPYWEGSYKKRFREKRVFRTDFYDSCTGEFLGWREFDGPEYEEEVLYPVENPNLRDDIATGYEAKLPMTDEEAQEAFRQAERRCQNDGVSR